MSGPTSQTSPPLVLHIWPKIDSVPSLDPSCNGAFLYLQICMRGRFSVEYCTDPDLSPSGQLPFLTHGVHSISGLSSIAQFASRHAGVVDLDAPLTSLEKAQSSARIAHVERELGDLVAHSLFALHSNYFGKTRPALVSALPVPQRYYVPSRLRDSYRPRLESLQLWHSPEIEEIRTNITTSVFRKKKKKQQDEQGKFKEDTPGRKKVIAKARDVLDVYARLLGEKHFFHGHERPTLLDIIFAAHIQLLLLPLPDPLLQTILSESYPTLISHANEINMLAFPEPNLFPSVVTTEITLSLRSLIPRPKFTSGTKPRLPTSPDEERRFAMMRWGFFGGAALLVAGYSYLIGLVPLYVKVFGKLQSIEELGGEGDGGIEEFGGELDDEDE